MSAVIPMQPELRAFPICDKLPKHCFAFPVVDRRCEPIFHLGEFVVVDPYQRDPVEEEPFLVEWIGGLRQIVATCRARVPADSAWRGCWWARTLRSVPLMYVDGSRAPERMRWSEGPYRPEHMREKLVGRVVGILQPRFDETTLRTVTGEAR